MCTPDEYQCPFCRIIKTRSSSAFDEVVWENSSVVVLSAKHHKIGNEGNVLVVPKEHISNIYELPLNLAELLLEATQKISIAMKAAFNCDGITISQNNEAAGGQDVWHYHVHVYPRYVNDNFSVQSLEIATAIDRDNAIAKLRQALL